MVAALGLAQIIAYGSSYYLPAVLAVPIAQDTGWPLAWVVGGLSGGLLVAGLASPRIGRIIEARGGRTVMAASAVLMALGLIGLVIAPSLAGFLAAWLVIGLGMGCGLYDATFATLGRLYGGEARSAIASLTLIGGFANTVCWPLSALLLSHFGWRGACLGYAAFDVVLLLPTYLWVLPRTVPPPAPPTPILAGASARPAGLAIFLLVGAVITFGSAISSVLSVHLLTLLSASGWSAAAAVALGATLGPSQVGGRLVEILTAHSHHPVWTMLAWTLLVAAGVGLMWVWPGSIPVALACYGAGIGIGSIARGTVPMALFGAAGYATRMGQLAFPSQLAQAASPVLGALLLGWAGGHATLGVLAGVAALDLALTAALIVAAWPQVRRAPRLER